MKTHHNIKEFRINGNMILMDYDKGEIIFPEDINQEEIEFIACYLAEEGFLDAAIKWLKYNNYF